MTEGSKVLDESDCDCDDDVDEDDIEDGNDDNVLEEIGEDDSDDDIEEDSNPNQEEEESIQDENNFRNLLQTTRYGRTCRTWRGRARAADFPWMETIFFFSFAMLLCTIYSFFKLSRRQEFNKWQWSCQCFTLLDEALGFLNIVNTNTFFIPMKKLSQTVTPIWILTMQHLNTQNFITGEGYKFLGIPFWRGQDFWAINRF